MSEKLEEILGDLIFNTQELYDRNQVNFYSKQIYFALTAIKQQVKEELLKRLPSPRGKQGCVGFIEDDDNYNIALEECRKVITEYCDE